MFFGSVLRDALAPVAVAEALDDFAGPPIVVSHSSSQALHNLRLRLAFSGILVTFQAAIYSFVGLLVLMLSWTGLSRLPQQPPTQTLRAAHP
jgi:hypothetical protein